MTKEEYVESILSYIDDKYARMEVKTELEAHLDDRIAFYTDAGYDYDYALDKAVGRMGDSETIGLQMNALHSNKKLNTFIWILSFIFYFLCVLFIVSFSIPEELSDFVNISGLLFDGAVLVFSVVYLLSSKHKNHKSLLLISATVLVGSFLYTSFFMYWMDIDWVTVSQILKFGATYIESENIKNFISSNEEIIGWVIGISKVILLHFISAIGIIYSVQIYSQIRETAKTPIIKRFRYFDVFALMLMIIDILPIVFICIVILR